MSLSHREWYHSHIHCTFRNLTRLGPALSTFRSRTPRRISFRTRRFPPNPSAAVLQRVHAAAVPSAHLYFPRALIVPACCCAITCTHSCSRRKISGQRHASAASAPAQATLTKAGSLSPRQATRSDRGHMWLFDYLWSMLNALGALRHCTDSHGAVLRCCCCCSRSRCCCACASQVWPTRTPRFSSLAWTMPARRRCCTCSRTSASRSTTRRSIRVRALPDSD